MEKARVLAGIAAHNEEKNIWNLLSVLTREKSVDAVVVVSSSTDNTNEIVKRYAAEESRVRLIVESERRGKSFAYNTIIEEAQKGNFDNIVYVGGDDLPVEGSVRALLDELLKKNVAVVGGKPRPVDSIQTFLGWLTHLQWNMHHKISERFEPKVSGELMAFRVGVVKEMPIAIINDDAYIQLMADAKGYEIRYCPSAIVKLKGCSSIKDLITQRRRVYLGHLQILFLTGIKVPTFKWRLYYRVLKESLPSFGLKEFCYLIGAITLQALAYLLALWDFHLFKIPYKWEIAETTKYQLMGAGIRTFIP